MEEIRNQLKKTEEENQKIENEINKNIAERKKLKKKNKK